MTAEQIRGLLEASTPGEWKVYGPTLKGDFWLYAPRDLLPGEVLEGDDEAINFIASEAGSRDAALIAAAIPLAHTALSALARAKAAEAEVERLRGVLTLIQAWAVRERDEAWVYEAEAKVDPFQPHKKGAALLHLVGWISRALAPHAALARPAAAEAGAEKPEAKR